jgi:hypothetical protein
MTLAPGAFTPAIRSLALDLMEALILRPAAVALADQAALSAPTLRGVLDRLGRKKHEELSEWKTDVDHVWTVARASGDETIVLICDELDRWFSKRYDELLRLSEFRFRDALTEVVAEMKEARDAYIAQQ